MSSELPDRRQANVRTWIETALAEAHSALLQALSTRMNQLLVEAVAILLGRSRKALGEPAVDGGKLGRRRDFALLVPKALTRGA